jgi:hypothetical protein
MGTASRAATVVRHYGHFRRPDGFDFFQRSPAGAWMLAAPTIYAAARSPHCTTSDRPIPQSSSTKKKVTHCEFSEFGILEKLVSNDATENAWFLSNLICLQENTPSSQQPAATRGCCWASFSCSWGTEGSPTGPRPGARHTLQPGRPPSSGTWGALLFPSGRLTCAHKQSVPLSGGKIVLALENSSAVTVKAPYSHRSTTLRCVFFNGPPPIFKKI